MNSERLKVLSLLGFIFLAGGGFLFYMFIWQPLQDRSALIAVLNTEVTEKDDAVREIERKLPALRQLEKRSLPAEIDLARREYEIYLNTLLWNNGFDMTSVKIDPRMGSAGGVPQLTNTKPAYTRLEFGVTIPTAKMSQVVKFLEEFYETNLLHQIPQITIGKPKVALSSRSGSSSDASRTVSVSLTVAAIVLDRAEKRDTLLPAKEVPIPPVLAAVDRHYAKITVRDPFYGLPPPPPPPSLAEEGPPPEPPLDVTPYVRLTSITFKEVRSLDDRVALQAIGGGLGAGIPEYSYAEAELYDRYHNYAYTVEMTLEGTKRMLGHFWLVGDEGRRKKRMSSSKTFRLSEEEGTSEYDIVRIDPTEVILRDAEGEGENRNALGAIVGPGAAGKFVPRVYRWYIGTDFKTMERVPLEDAKQFLNLPLGVGLVSTR